MPDDTHAPPQNFHPIAHEDLAELGVESRLIPFVITTTLRAERSPDDSPQLTLAEAKCLIEILDMVMSSAKANLNLKDRCFGVLRKVSPAHCILPRSYFPTNVTLSNDIPHASGGFADVWKGRQDGKRVCVKAFRTQTAGNPEQIKRRFYHEIVGWKRLSHPNVLPFVGVSESLFPFSIISPWLPYGDIARYIRKHRGVNRLRLLAQAAHGLKYLHSQSIVHSGITPGNILITEEGNACLGDFGITGIITDPTFAKPGSMTTSKPGVIRYMAPELLDPHLFGFKNSSPSKESDVFSFAMTAYQVLSGDLPYGVRRETVTAFNIVTGVRPPRPRTATADLWLPDPIWDVIRRCWKQEPQFRLSTKLLYQEFAKSVPEHEGGTPVAGSGVGMANTRYEPAPPPPEEKPARRTPPSTSTPRNGPGPPTPPPGKPNWIKGLAAKIGFH